MRGVPTRVGLLGGGVIGAGWAARFVLHGVDVALYDPDPGAVGHVETALTAAGRAYEQLYSSAVPPRGAVDVVGTVDDAVIGADFVQESAPERLELKRGLLARADAVADPEVVIASSTSGLRPSALRAGLAHGDRVIAGHPFNPVYLLPLVEVCGGDPSTAPAVDRAVEVYRSIGMQPLVLPVEADGFVADRLLEALWREALWLVEDGIATASQIDDAIRFGPGVRWSAMGAFLTYRLAGGDAGMRHFLTQFGPALQWPWTKLTDVPELDDELIGRIVEQSDEQAAGRSIDELTARRDECLVAVLRALRTVGWGAGQVVADHDRALAERTLPTATPELVDITFTDGHRGSFHPLWLRDNCPCAECVHPQTDERVLDTFALDPQLTARRVEVRDDVLTLDWPDGHRSELDLGWLRRHCYCADCGGAGSSSAQELWCDDGADGLTHLRYDDVIADDAGLAAFVDAVWIDGAAFVHEVPTTDRHALHQLAQRVGVIRETNFGLDWHVRAVLDPNNVAFTSVALHPHTDLTNCETPPGVQFLLCISASAPGGDSVLVDGFAVAEHLRRHEPEVYARLRDTPIPYRFHDADHDLRASAPVITERRDGSLSEVRFHNALRAPLDVPVEQIGATYAALRRFHELAGEDRFRVQLRLRPGDLMVFHNRRVLHGRSAFDPGGGARHLIGLYVDVDDWLSRRRMLAAAADGTRPRSVAPG